MKISRLKLILRSFSISEEIVLSLTMGHDDVTRDIQLKRYSRFVSSGIQSQVLVKNAFSDNL